MGDKPRLFVWRGISSFEGNGYSGAAVPGVPPIYHKYYERCPFCKSVYSEISDAVRAELPPHESPTLQRATECTLCGFTYENYLTSSPFNPTWDYVTIRFATLKNLAIDDAELAIDELGSHLKRRFSDVYSIPPRMFEELIADIYKHLGYHTRLTKATRDGGYDVVLLEKTTGAQIIIECKRWSAERKVDVGVVRGILGVQFLTQNRKAKIVTTTRFSDDAKAAANKARGLALKYGISGYELELVDVEQLTRALDVYNTRLPPLSLEDRINSNG